MSAFLLQDDVKTQSLVLVPVAPALSRTAEPVVLAERMLLLDREAEARRTDLLPPRPGLDRDVPDAPRLLDPNRETSRSRTGA